ncbi:MAG: hypothetical protein KC897_04395 [Candidatus Omnitrophica bacterium]|nr:hypothetical protein [Candidatus Omnitrophota bacterium]MCB9720479.1 hypothetical protein [Candidatus Omnitrophota bacterium]
MISLKTSVRNIVTILFILLGCIFFLYSYMLSIIPVIDLGYMTLGDIYTLDGLLFLIIAMSVFTIVKSKKLVYRGRRMCVRRTFWCISSGTLKILFCICLTYCFFYYSITFE